MASKRDQNQSKRRAQQDSENQSGLLAHIPDDASVAIDLRMRGIRLLRRACQNHKPRDGAANRRNPRNLSEHLKPALHAALIMEVISASLLPGFISSKKAPKKLQESSKKAPRTLVAGKPRDVQRPLFAHPDLAVGEWCVDLVAKVDAFVAAKVFELHRILPVLLRGHGTGHEQTGIKERFIRREGRRSPALRHILLLSVTSSEPPARSSQGDNNHALPPHEVTRVQLPFSDPARSPTSAIAANGIE